MKNILLAGCGNMGTALLEGWLNDNDIPAGFTVIDPDRAAHHPLAADPRVTMLPAVDASTPAPDMIVLAVKPQIINEAIKPLAAIAKPDTVWLSIAAGITIDGLRKLIGGDAKVIRAMPNTPALIGHGITAMIASETVSAATREEARRMLFAVGTVEILEDEADMDAVTAVSGSGPAYVFHLREALQEAALEAGLDAELAASLAAETIAGAARLMEKSDDPPSTLRKNVTSPGGTTEAALKILMDDENGMTTLMKKAVAAAQKRSRELGKN